MLAFLDDLLWGKILVVGLVALGLVFTVRSRFVQFRYFGRMFGVFGEAVRRQPGQISSFQALMLSVAGRVGAGNIAGVAVAIALGGPGAVFWMWVVALVGMATSYFECTLAQLYKQPEPDGSYRGGPAFYIARGLRQRWLAMVFSVLLLVTFGFGFNAVQSYTVATSLNDAFGIPTYWTGIALVAVLGIIIFGGISRIAQAADVLVPVMACGYILLTLFVVVTRLPEVPGVLALIFKSAFGLEPAIGGGMGAAILLGVKRGLFSNEAGLGSAPNVAAVAHVPHPASQGIVQAFSVFIDTIIICSCTAFIILLSPTFVPGAEQAGVALTQQAMAGYVGEWGRIYVSIALMLFVFTSIIYNYYLGETSIDFFAGNNRVAFSIFRIAVMVLVFWGSVQDLSTVFAFADITMGLLAVVNLLAVTLLFRTGLRIMRDYDRQIAEGIDNPVFDSGRFSDLDIDRGAWPARG
ncbi:alanine/glycine:cation symporter family protein [Chelatococcus composti]|jgi:amino acid carrier protein|uniref:AGCS family alanine or glycine:cation symporter n=1 Tax=Chelatococcus composti TaxID=1743235 RepID=A0A841KF35_9HYPH|nr:alanine/glycine:cation symporter family protein [Chelatococcus composti]MBB6168546.1 AGCS family alanine or glycine:cation symporter [Chelatococcus composti]MBS7736375.1 alanine:cation symporter family protein [Chelatococcus composti]PZN43085.1 MAG: sodium:alanine symporter [Pseudomonadota bacterium]GGG40938.1 AGCS sodium/alanine/glycine symporter [Chelatococcus composti]